MKRLPPEHSFYNRPASMDLFTFAETAQPSCTPIAPPMQHPCAAPAQDLPQTFWSIVTILTSRIGKDRAITALQIAAAINLFPDGTDGSRSRRVRDLLELHFPDLPWPLCADDSGYYRPANADELTHYHANLHGRAMAILQRLSTLKRIAPLSGFEYHGHGKWLRREAPAQQA